MINETGFTRTECVEFDGSKYRIIIFEEGPEFYAIWHCDTCCRCGGTVHNYASEALAINAAAVKLQPHHALYHRPMPTPPFTIMPPPHGFDPPDSRVTGLRD